MDNLYYLLSDVCFLPCRLIIIIIKIVFINKLPVIISVLVLSYVGKYLTFYYLI